MSKYEAPFGGATGTAARIKELEAENERLKLENRRLNGELNALDTEANGLATSLRPARDELKRKHRDEEDHHVETAVAALEAA